MAQWGKGLATKPSDLPWICSTHPHDRRKMTPRSCHFTCTCSQCFMHLLLQITECNCLKCPQPRSCHALAPVGVGLGVGDVSLQSWGRKSVMDHRYRGAVLSEEPQGQILAGLWGEVAAPRSSSPFLSPLKTLWQQEGGHPVPLSLALPPGSPSLCLTSEVPPAC